MDISAYQGQIRDSGWFTRTVHTISTFLAIFLGIFFLRYSLGGTLLSCNCYCIVLVYVRHLILYFFQRISSLQCIVGRQRVGGSSKATHLALVLCTIKFIFYSIIPKQHSDLWLPRHDMMLPAGRNAKP
jgi:hypothetical protein